jgi:hypothetical protein
MFPLTSEMQMDVEIKMDQLTFDLAHQVAVNELIRFILIEMASGDGGSAFRNRLRKIEEGVVTSLRSSRHFPAIGDQEEAVIREAACGFVTRLIASIPTQVAKE